MTIHDLGTDEYGAYYESYIQSNPNLGLLKCLASTKEEFLELLNSISEEKFRFSYAEGKWSLAELFQHVIDAERVFQYRAMRFARNDKTPLPGFEQDGYVTASRANEKSIENLRFEFTSVRDATIALFSTLNEEELQRIGIASDTNFSVRALGFIISGHQLHHQKIVRERYL
ncbi:DinB family protein [Allomuricauda sp. d1]|uniref:DinB family protein n=1 Tax=Allomuricauda sp. d1 TaxID=3136725 RepID=UPI0031E387BE